MGIPPKSTSKSTISRQNHQQQKNRKQPNSSNRTKILSCDQCRTAAVDVMFFIIVMGATGFLVLPFVKIFCCGVSRIGGAVLSMVKNKVHRSPMIYACIGIFLVIWSISKCTSKKCRNPNCRGLRNSKKFDILLETEEAAQNSSSSVREDDPAQDFLNFLYQCDKKLQDRVREIAPENGRAVLVFQARCGCPIGRIEVPGSKKLHKIKKKGEK